MSPTTPRRAGFQPSEIRHPEGLALFGREGMTRDGGVVVCVHGTLDRATSFSRVARRLDDATVWAYDRRGYQGSRGAGVSKSLSFHVGDLLELIALVRGDGPVSVFGHSLGGVIAIAAGIAAPGTIDSIVVYEPPMRWLFGENRHRSLPDPADPGGETEAFFRRIVSDDAWERLSDEGRRERTADGPALVADLTMVRQGDPFTGEQLETLAMPLTIGIGGRSDHPRYRRSADVALARVPHGSFATVEGAAHGAHLSHPDGIATLIRSAGPGWAGPGSPST